MALETPNRLVAALLLYIDIDPAVVTPNRFSLRTSSGIKRKLSEFEVPLAFAVATWELEQPVTNDEALVVANFLGSPGAGIFGISVFGWITPLAQLVGPYPALNTIVDDNLLVTSAQLPSGVHYKGRNAVLVFGLPTTATPIPGEPNP